ncbi:hypothetical protein P4O66_015570 [Electrophorus voltai]|uniref:SH3 domain-containing protein n=1 Tax=Electrophorus voltai TaxID=2609070 RepID=A0AAD8YZR2_9TELE|nr:hypothetical protein P4O66_015570 [Electrophorus voltai]
MSKPGGKLSDNTVKKLILLDTKDKIWIQEMLLQVSNKASTLLDCDTMEELENFPLSTVHHSQTVLNKTRYPSVVLLVCQDTEQHKLNIHFFYCDDVAADIVHADIASALGDNKHGKKMRPQTLKMIQENMKQQRKTIIPPSEHKGPTPGLKGVEREGLAQQDTESHEQLAQHTEKDVVKDMLTLRAITPSEAEFINSIQKLKLSFNLLFFPSQSSSRSFTAPLPGRKYAKILYHFVAGNANELPVLQDEVLEVIEDDKQWSKLWHRSGHAGYVPYNILDVVTLDDLHNMDLGLDVTKPMDEVNDELLLMFRRNQPPIRKFRVEHRSNPTVPLTINSSCTYAPKSVCKSRGDSELQEVMKKQQEKITSSTN